MSDRNILANLGRPRRIWAIAACNGLVERLEDLNIAVADRFSPGDRLVYLGNYLGGSAPVETIDHLLAFRSSLLARPGMMPDDIVYLRGVQEEIWTKLLQIQFAPNPKEVLRWMIDRGAGTTLEAYGGDSRAGLSAAQEGASAMARWTNRLREAIRQHAGHDKFMSVLQRAATSRASDSESLLFVHAGLNPSRPVIDQGDNFWWDAKGYDGISGRYENFARIFRGHDPSGKGIDIEGYAVTLDGSPDGGPLIAACIAPEGDIIDVLET